MPTSENSGCNGNVRALEQREFLLRWARRLACVAAVAALSVAGFHLYGVLRNRHLARQTQEFIARGDFKSAVLVARRLLELDENDLAASRAMAQVAEASGSAEAVKWRKHVVHLEPGVAANQLALAKAALRFGQSDLAAHALKSIPGVDRATLEFHQIAGAQALGQKQLATAEAHFAAALQIEPRNPQLSLNLASIRLGSPDRETAEQARTNLAQLTEQPAARLEALRALTADALARRDRKQAQKWAAHLKSEMRAGFSDALLCFQAVEGTDDAAPALEELKQAATTPVRAAELITWLNRHQLAIVAAHWGARLPQQMLEAQPVPLAIAESYSFLQDWTALLAWVEGKNWGSYEPLRLAVESHALHRLTPANRESMEAQSAWRAALKEAQDRPGQLVALAQLAEGWGYQADAEEAWWLVANSPDQPKAGLSALQRLYKSKQDTRGLLRVAKRALELNPADLVAANNCANLGLLLTGDSTARRLAARLHAEHPTNRAFAATHAFGLHTGGKQAEALSVMERLKEEELRHPSIAAYYFVILVEAGKTERARSFLPIAQRATLLPEEQQLVATAARKLAAAEAQGAATVGGAATIRPADLFGAELGAPRSLRLG
ncbi:MAG: tetratricopeptide repeat protein [Chthoniobacterales bacterium]